MKKFFSLSQCFLICAALLLSTNVLAVTCASNSNPSENCSDLLLSNPSSEITIPVNVTVTRDILYSISIDAGSTTNSLINNGALSGGAENVLRVNGRIENFNNTGSITNTNNAAISLRDSGASIGTILNSGSIYAADGHGILLYPGSQVTTITNTGSIDSGVSDKFSIQSRNTSATASITNLNNSYNALTYSGNLPTNYKIIINSTSAYGKLIYTNNLSYPAGTTIFGIYAGSLITSRLYTGVLQGLSTGNVGVTRTGTYDNMTWTLSQTVSTAGSENWNLAFVGVSLLQTQSSLFTQASRLRGIFNASLASSNFANMNTNDCNLFDTKGMCISAGGRYTTVDNPNSNNTSAVVVVGYKASPNIRIGGFLDRSVNNNTPTGIRVSIKNPLMGAFAVWNQNADGLGVQVKLANAYQDKDVTTTRDVIGTSEAGTGATNLNTQSYVGELSYAFLANQDKTTLRPYLALRQTTIKQDAYTETGVDSPLSYAALTDRSTAALVGLKLNHALTPKATLTASLGIEQDLEHKVDQYTATSADISGLTSENFNDNIKRTRPVASLGAYYALTKTQRISGDVYYQQLPFQSTGSTTAYFNYMIGL